MTKPFFLIAALLGFLSVAFGAFGAHGLRHKVTPEMLVIFETGARYQMFHALALLFLAYAGSQLPQSLLKLSGWFFIFGTLIFSGSLYTLVLSGVRAWGAVTPIGGLLLLCGWASLIAAALRR